MSEYSDKINETHATVQVLDRAIRGHNGTPGMLTQMTLMNQTMNDLVAKVSKINDEGCDFKFRSEYESKVVNNNVTPAKPPEKSRLAELGDKIVVPVAVSLVLGFFQVLPKLIVFFDQLANQP